MNRNGLTCIEIARSTPLYCVGSPRKQLGVWLGDKPPSMAVGTPLFQCDHCPSGFSKSSFVSVVDFTRDFCRRTGEDAVRDVPRGRASAFGRGCGRPASGERCHRSSSTTKASLTRHRQFKGRSHRSCQAEVSLLYPWIRYLAISQTSSASSPRSASSTCQASTHLAGGCPSTLVTAYVYLDPLEANIRL